MSTLSLRLAPSGALTLRQAPGFDHERALRLAVIRLGLTEPLRKRRADNLEGFMKPDQHNDLPPFFGSGAMLVNSEF